jgi:phage tail sheath protein FI
MNNSSSTSTNGALDSGSQANVRLEVINSNTGSNGGIFTIIVRRGDDNESQKNILETWANISLDPQLPNYIARVIGDLKPVYNSTERYVEYQGTYPNASQYVRVVSVGTPNVDSIDNNGNFKTGSYANTLPVVGSGSFNGGFSGGKVDTTSPKLMNEATTITNIQGFAPADYNTAFTLLSNRDEYQFNVLMAPGVGLDCSAATNMIACVEGRGDAIALTSAGKYGTSIVAATTAAAGQSSNYAATYYPWIQLYSAGLGKVVWCPPTTVMGGVLAFNDQVGAEWFAPAGLNRGGVPSVVRAERRLQQTDRDVLYTGNVNPLATFPGTGVCVWGQKTLQRKPTSLDRVNVRRLLIALKGFIGGVSRNLVFEQNTTVTRNSFLSRVNPYLESVVQRQGLYAYKVVMDETNNTADVVDRNQLVGQIYIQPTKTAEFIILNFNILPTGATFPA